MRRSAWTLLRHGLGAWLVVLCALIPGPLWAEEAGAPVRQVTVERDEGGLMLSARLPLTMSSELVDVLHRGVPLHFLWRATVVQPRWYWTDKRVTTTSRLVRLVYQPLTRRWRLSVTSGIQAEQGALNALHQNVETLQEALAVVTRVSDWKVADATALDPDTSYRVVLRFELDPVLMPRPFQIGASGERGGAVDIEEAVEVGPERRGGTP